MTKTNKIKNIFFNILAWINRCFYILILVIYLFLSYTTPKCTEEYIKPDGTSVDAPIRLDYRSLNNLILFIPIIPLVLSTFLEWKDKKIRYFFICITVLCFFFFIISRIIIECPEIS